MNSDQSRAEMLLVLLRAALGNDISEAEGLLSSTVPINWAEIYRYAAEHGVLAIAWDGINALYNSGKLSAEQMPARALKLQWALSSERIEQKYSRQQHLAEELSAKLASQGLATFVLKGLSISRYYPIPNHRECGDLDCFFSVTSDDKPTIATTNERGLPISGYDKGNKLAAEIGAKVGIGFYKHSHITYKGLTIENHQFCTAVRGSKRRKALERHIQELLTSRKGAFIGESKLIAPCADFNALFLTAHSVSHFMTEGIRLRHIIDWAVLLKHEEANINWDSFYSWCDRMRYTKFVNALNTIAVRYLGFAYNSDKICTESEYAERVLDDVLHKSTSIHNTKASKFQKRLMIIKARMLGNWKYRELCNTSAFVDLLQTITAFFIERKPKI